MNADKDTFEPEVRKRSLIIYTGASLWIKRNLGKAVAAEVRSEIATRVAELGNSGVPVRRDVVLVGDDAASLTYVRMK